MDTHPLTIGGGLAAEKSDEKPEPNRLFRFVDRLGGALARHPDLPPLTILDPGASEEQPEAAPASPADLPPAAADPPALLRRLVVPAETRARLEGLIAAVRAEPLIYDTWGLRSVAPPPRYALIFHGPPGTGKTLAAHAVASALGRKVLTASFAPLESARFGGPDTLEAAFAAAGREGAVLLLEDADPVLACGPSADMPGDTPADMPGAEPSADARRSRLLRCLEHYPVLAILAVSRPGRCHPALASAASYLAFPLPDPAAQAALWQSHLPPALPLAGDVSVAALLEAAPTATGRDIKDAVLRAATQAAVEGSPNVAQRHFRAALQALNAP